MRDRAGEAKGSRSKSEDAHRRAGALPAAAGSRWDPRTSTVRPADTVWTRRSRWARRTAGRRWRPPRLLGAPPRRETDLRPDAAVTHCFWFPAGFMSTWFTSEASAEGQADSQHPPLQDSVDAGLREGAGRSSRERVVHLGQQELHTWTGGGRRGHRPPCTEAGRRVCLPVSGSSRPRPSAQKQYEETSGNLSLNPANVWKASGNLTHTQSGGYGPAWLGCSLWPSCQVSSPVEGGQQVQLGSVRRVDEFTLNREEAAVRCTLWGRRKPCAVEETP